ncbi:helix-turn-helix domain-containing protein [[Clostridium] leptum]|nr:helix-turn-helix domain-containing protein [[Clostridium] leptum]
MASDENGAVILGYYPGLPITLSWGTKVRTGWHYHRGLHLLYVVEGSLSFSLEDRSYTILPNQLGILNSMQLHEGDDKKTSGRWIDFCIELEDYETLWPELRGLYFNIQDSTDKREEVSSVYQLFANIVREASERKKGFAVRIHSLCDRMIVLLATHFSYPRSDMPSGSEGDRQLETVLEYIDTNYGQSWSLGKLASKACLSPQYLSRRFSNRMGMPLSEYINTVRVKKSLPDIIAGNQSVHEIAQSYGFANITSYYKMFRKIFHTTPHQYFKKYQEEVESSAQQEAEQADQFGNLFSYISMNHQESDLDNIGPPDLHISVDLGIRIRCLNKSWGRVCCLGRISDSMDFGWREQVVRVQRDLSFEYMICNDFKGVMIESERENDGAMSYQFGRLNHYLDFLRSMHLKPMIELGFVPSQIAEDVHLPAYVYPPNDLSAWCDMVHKIMNHIVNRYGRHEVRNWKFCIWHNPDSRAFWPDRRERFAELFIRTYQIIKRVDPEIQVGGCGFRWQTAHHGWLQNFSEYLKKDSISPDFLSFCLHGVQSQSDQVPMSVGDLSFLDVKKQLHFGEPDSCIREVREIRSLLESLHWGGKPLWITNFNIHGYVDDPIHDTNFMAAFLVKNMLAVCNEVESISFCPVIDRLGNGRYPGIFHGGCGLLTRNGIPKGSYNALLLLDKLGDMVVEQGDSYIVTSSQDGNYQILCYNYCHYNQEYSKTNVPGLYDKDRFNDFAQESSLSFQFELKGIRGHYRIKHTSINRSSGSALDAWIRMGMPEHCLDDEVDILKSRSVPDCTIKTVTYDGTANLQLILEPHEVALVELIRN